MSEGQDTERALLESKLQPVAPLESEELGQYKKSHDFVGLSKEELKEYINNPKWKRIRWIIALLYLLALLGLLAGSILLVVFSSKCPPRPKLDWYEKNLIYEVDLLNFQDSNGDGLGDLQGLENRLKYFEENQIKSILLAPSIFNQSTDYLTVDPTIATEAQLNNLLKIFNRKDMTLIIDLPLSTTLDAEGLRWYGSNQNFKRKVTDPCANNARSLVCRYYQSYGTFPLNFQNKAIVNQSLSRISHWLSTKKFDGVRVNLPLVLNNATRSYSIAEEVIEQWIALVDRIAKKSKAKLLFFDIPPALEEFITKKNLQKRTVYSLGNPRSAADLSQRLTQLPRPAFWKIQPQEQLKKEMVLTLTMLLGGTPVLRYGEEINLNQSATPLMSWRPDQPFGGFSNCTSGECRNRLAKYEKKLAKSSVQREEAAGGAKQDSLLKLFRFLARLRQKESFQYGLLDWNFDQRTNIFWFIREASGHHGYVVVLNLQEQGAEEEGHISLSDLSSGNVPTHIHCEYQWPIVYLPISNSTHLNSDNLVIHPQSINIFSWPTKPIKPKALKNQLQEHRH